MKIIWNSESSVIPNYGVAESGKEVDLPEEVAIKFINTGQAMAMPEPKTKKVKGEGE